MRIIRRCPRRIHQFRTAIAAVMMMSSMFAVCRPRCGVRAFRAAVFRTASTSTSQQQARSRLPSRLVIAAPSFRLYSASAPVNGQNSTSGKKSATTLPRRSSSILKFEDTPLGQNGSHLLNGLDRYTVSACDDGHPLSVYGISSSENPVQLKDNADVKPILLLHGRTWSAVPVYHLMGHGTMMGGGGGRSANDDGNDSATSSRSLMEALLQKGLQPYTMDFRGFGGTHADDSNSVEPYKCVQDAESVLKWIADRHGLCSTEPPALLGWSQGALIAQLAAQKLHPLLSKVILYGSIYDPLVRYPREPLYLSNPPPNASSSTNTSRIVNQYDDAIEDFTVEGTIAPEPARIFAEAALVADPHKAVWRNLFQFNNCDPARVHVPTLVVAGDQDPYAPLHVQQELFSNLGRASDRTWSILSGSDHASHLLDGRERLINTVVSFVLNGKRTEQHD